MLISEPLASQLLSCQDFISKLETSTEIISLFGEKLRRMILGLLLLLQSAAPLMAQDDPPSLVKFEDLKDLNAILPDPDCNYPHSSLTETHLQVSARCCPSNGTICEDHLNGRCHLWWVLYFWPIRCDYIINNLCTDTACKCCISCNEFSRSQCSENGGACRARCTSTDFEANYLECESCLCKCCQKCDQTQRCTFGENGGRCVGDENSCGSGHYITQDCNPDQPCHCCRRCKQDVECRQLGGYCERRSLECQQGYVKHSCGCEPDNDCTCCIPEDALDCAPGPGCSNGYCTTDPCPFWYQTTPDCIGNNPACHCCKPFVISESAQPAAPAQVRQEQNVNINVLDP